MASEVVAMAEQVETGRMVGALEAAGDVTVERALVGALSAHNVRMQMAVRARCSRAATSRSSAPGADRC